MDETLEAGYSLQPIASKDVGASIQKFKELNSTNNLNKLQKKEHSLASTLSLLQQYLCLTSDQHHHRMINLYHTKAWSFGYPDPRLLASRTVRNKHLSFINHSDHDTVVQHPILRQNLWQLLDS